MCQSCIFFYSVAIMVLIGSCAGNPDPPNESDAGESAVNPVPSVREQPFGELPDGRSAMSYVVRARDIEMHVADYGATITSLLVPDAEGERSDLVLGFDTLDGYLSDAYREATPYFGAVIGRYGNRIGGARFELDGETMNVTANTPPHLLHGGARGFDRVPWDAEPFERTDAAGVVFRRASPAGEEGFPGTLDVEVTYTLSTEGELTFDYRATTDAPTPVNLTQHSYFNLAGENKADILDHRLMIKADSFTPVDSGLIPTGEIRPVDGTPFDFRTATPIGARIDEQNQQLEFGGGYDHNFVLDREGLTDDELVLAACVTEPTSGRIMEIHTTEPGLQFYSGNFLDASFADDEGRPFEYRNGFALETQHFPDSPNRPEYPSTILRPGEEYTSRTVLRFSAMDTIQAQDGDE